MLNVHNKNSCEVVIMALNGKYMTPSSLFLERGGGLVGDIEGLNLKQIRIVYVCTTSNRFIYCQTDIYLLTKYDAL